MKIRIVSCGVLVCVAIAIEPRCGFAQKPVATDSKTDKAPPGDNEDLKAIRSAVEAYVEAFNAADAASVAKCWSDQGVYLSSGGVRITGPASIERHFADYLADNPGLRLTVAVDSLRLLDTNVAIEEGTAHLVRENDSGSEPDSEATYVAVHVKRDGVWKLDTVRETDVPGSDVAESPLQVLDWLIGEWTDDTLEGVQVESSYRWANDNKFIVNTFQVVIDGAIDLEGTQILGWDPSRQTIRSWLFDSDGGFGEGTWSQGDSDMEWTVETKSVMPDGRHASAINHYSRADDDSFRWSSTERQVGEASLPDVDPITVRRTQPQE